MGIGQIIYDFIFSFNTPHIVQVRNFKVGLVHRLTQTIIIGYVIGMVIVYKKGYQETDEVKSSVTTKVKGVASTLHRHDLPPEYRRVWDTPDYVVPPQEYGAFFVMTNAILTPAQVFGNCAEDPHTSPCNMSSPHECEPGKTLQTGNGVMTGRCVHSGSDHQNRPACEITGWCPVETDKLPSQEPLLPQMYNFTVLIKNSIEFPKFAVRKRNIRDDVDNLKECRFNKDTDKTCPVLKLGDIIEESGANFSFLASNGGVINIDIEWNCDLDRSLDECLPAFKFSEMDYGRGHVALGWNFRYASYYRNSNGTLARELVKATGVLFIFTVHGKAGKFNIVPLLQNVGAGLALLSIATVIADVIMLHCVEKRRHYKDHKFMVVADAGAGVAPETVERRETSPSTDHAPVSERNAKNSSLA